MIRREFLSRMTIASTLAVSTPALAWADTLKRHATSLAPRNGYLLPLTQRQLAFIAAVAERIIPATDTGGAAAAEVAPFIGYLYANWMLVSEQRDTLRGLDSLASSAEAALAQPFENAAEHRQIALVGQWDANAYEARPHDAPAPFFRRLKELVLVGYYTSTVGQDSELQVQFGGGQGEPGGPAMSQPPFVHI
jgi:gluconate 2-dehydrogenase gamma chain